MRFLGKFRNKSTRIFEVFLINHIECIDPPHDRCSDDQTPVVLLASNISSSTASATTAAASPDLHMLISLFHDRIWLCRGWSRGVASREEWRVESLRVNRALGSSSLVGRDATWTACGEKTLGLPASLSPVGNEREWSSLHSLRPPAAAPSPWTGTGRGTRGRNECQMRTTRRSFVFNSTGGARRQYRSKFLARPWLCS